MEVYNMTNKKILVAYFSASGVTAKTAAHLAEALHASLFEIKPEIPYTKDDLNWTDPNSRSSRERDQSVRPAIASRVENMAQYDTVFIGFPIWWFLPPTIINTFLESYDFSGKTVIPFATSGGSGMGNTDKILRALCPDAVQWRPGKLLSPQTTGTELAQWVKKLKL